MYWSQGYSEIMENMDRGNVNHFDGWRHSLLSHKEPLSKTIKDVVFLTLTFFSFYMLLFLIFDLLGSLLLK